MIFIVSGPGGVGKGTIVKELVSSDPTLWLSRSWTTRARRPGEPEDAYTFVSEDQFKEHIAAGGFLEWVEFLGNYYGTPVVHASPGRDVLLEIELKGAQNVRRHHPDAVLVLVVPPSVEVQRERLRGRGDSDEGIERRIEMGRKELEIGQQLADEIIVNDDLDTAVQALAGIVERYRALHP